MDPSLSPSQFYPKVPGEFLEVGTVEVNRDSTVDDLKMQILTLPAVSHLSCMYVHASWYFSSSGLMYFSHSLYIIIWLGISEWNNPYWITIICALYSS